MIIRVKLHIGCGKRYLVGFKHLDLADYPHIDYRQHISDLSNFNNGSVDEIYTSHTLEYFDFSEIQQILREFYRILKPNGSVYLSVPDFKKLTQIYNQTNDLNTIIGPLFGKWSLNENLIYHKAVYDELIMIKFMEEIGFRCVKKYDPVKYLSNYDNNYDDYSLAYFPHMDKKGILISLNMSGIK